MLKRLYVQKADGKCYQLPLAHDNSGNISPAAITSTTAYKPDEISANHKVLTEAQVINMAAKAGMLGKTSQIQNSLSTMEKGQNIAVVPAMTSTHKLAAARVEMGDTAGQGKSIFITLQNTHATLAQPAIIFDGAGYGGTALGITTNGVVVIDGSFGALTLVQLKAGTALLPQSLKTLHLVSQTLTVSGTAADAGTGTPATIATRTPSSKFYDNGGTFSTFEADVAGSNPKEVKYNFNKDFRQDTYQPSIRFREEFRFLADAMHGIRLLIPALTMLTVSFDIDSVGRAYNMVQE